MNQDDKGEFEIREQRRGPGCGYGPRERLSPREVDLHVETATDADSFTIVRRTGQIRVKSGTTLDHETMVAGPNCDVL